MKKTIIATSLIAIGLLAYIPSITSAESPPAPIAFWNFNNQIEVNAGLISDIIGQYNSENNNGTWINDGYDGGGIEFSCSNCTLVTPSLPINNAITLLFRMKASDMANATTQRTIYTAYESHAYIFGGAANDPNEVNKITTAQMGNFTVSDDNNWHHYAFTWDRNGKHSYYKDGVLIGYATGPGIQNMGGQITFGMGTESTTPTIKLDEIKIYDQTLTADQIAEESVNNKLLCKSDTWSCGDWGTCSIEGSQTRSCTKIFDCSYISTPSPNTSQSCDAPTPKITSVSPSSVHLGDQVEITGENFGISAPQEDCPAQIGYAQTPCGFLDGSNRPQTILSWSDTKIRAIIDNTDIGQMQFRTILHSFISNDDKTRSSNNGYINVLAPSCSEDTWSCGDWTECSRYGSQTRSCTKTFDCPSAWSTSPATTKSCTYVPACTEDTWSCGAWNSCAANGIRTRSCTKTLDCSSVETAPPATSEFCRSAVTPSVPSTTPNTSNQNTIIKASVKLLCPVDSKRASQGSGTVIDSEGTILTNKHVVEGTLGCYVGFIDSLHDKPYFGSRHIADIQRVSTNKDIAILKLRNPGGANLASTNITTSNSNALRLGDEIHTYGYPAQFGDNITFTSGDFSGVEGDYLKTTAILEYGNSGGGAYSADGKFIGIPSAVSTGKLNSLGLILSVNAVNAWVNNSSLAYTPSQNNYSRVSILEDIDLGELDQFQLYIPGSDLPNDEPASTPQNSTEDVSPEKTTSFTQRVVGRILLQVEAHGEAHYVDPISTNRYYLKDGTTAYSALRKFGLGINDTDLSKIPVGIEKRFNDTDTDGDGLPDKLEEGLKTDPHDSDSDNDGVSDGTEVLVNKTNPLGYGVLSTDNLLVNRLKGRILLQVESRGEAWYINPDDGKRYYMKNGDAAYQIMRYLSLGITDSDLRKISIGEI